MFLDKIIKNKKMIISLISFLILGLLFRYTSLKSYFLLIILTIAYIFVVYYIINIIFRSYFTKLKFYIFFLTDLIVLLIGRLSLGYVSIHILMYILIIILVNKTEGIIGLKKGGILFLIYTLIKMIYIGYLVV